MSIWVSGSDPAAADTQTGINMMETEMLLIVRPDAFARQPPTHTRPVIAQSVHHAVVSGAITVFSFADSKM